jgi:hypothetical protein
VYAQFIWDKYSSIWTEYSDFFNATAATLQILQILIYSKNQTAPKKFDLAQEFLYVMGPPKKMRPDRINVDGEIVDYKKWPDIISKDWVIALEGHTVQPSGARDAGEILDSYQR